ncbi:MAG: exodeoxyribonuclease VII large subunit, partial [Alphaproteobacteria bacterium]
MAELDTSLAPNVPEYSVGELSAALKRTIEDAYGFVRVRGEVSKWFVARSGHAYLTLKDGNNVLEGVCWKTRVGRLAIAPEEGLEIVASGRLTTFPGRSQYQLVVEEVQAHGLGALLAQLEERKKRLAEEGLFAAERKRPLPFLPEVVGVVTSPTGAVIRDILHRLRDRFPRPVLVWPVTVQGERCGPEVAHAIRGFAALPEAGWPRRPDVLVVARGGGSIEDLWGFNDEAVVRAAAASPIPLVAAVGHETDTTLIDLAADVRAPTPSAAAELIVPVAAEIRTRLGRDGERLAAAFQRRFNDAVQAVDDAGERLPRVTRRLVEEQAARLRTAGYRLRTPAEQIRARGTALETAARDLERG